MTTNKDIENAVFEKYPESRIERGIGLNVLRGYEKIYNAYFVLKLNSNQRDHSWMTGPWFFAVLPVSAPFTIYRSKQYEKGVDIKSVDISGEETNSKYFKLPFFMDYIYQEANKLGIDYRDGPKRTVLIDCKRPKDSVEDVIESIEKITDFDNIIKNKYQSKKNEIIGYLRN